MNAQNTVASKWRRRSGLQERRTLSNLQHEVQALKTKIAQMEARQESHEIAYRVPQSLAELKPRRQPPPGKTAMEAIQGQWPSEESTEELLARLKELD